MKIFKDHPVTWQDLQDYVGQLFTEIGYDVVVSKVIPLVRGQKEIDVFVYDQHSEYGTTFLIECKNWNKPVNQETVHAFRSVIVDAGANFGFIVSKSGFQSGSYEAAEQTNIKLVSLEELEERFYKKWQTGMTKRYMPFADRLFPYWDFAGGKSPVGGPISWNTKMLLNEAYAPFIHLGPGDIENFRPRSYPQKVPILDDSFQIIGQTTLLSDRDYFDFIETYKDVALRHYMMLYREI